jgi:hypothetical protein
MKKLGGFLFSRYKLQTYKYGAEITASGWYI